MTEIVCDLGEERSGIPGLLEQSGVRVERTRLDTGDYLVSGAIAVERKAAGDFVGAVLSERLLPQLDLLASTHEIAIFLLEGDKWDGDRSLKTPMLARLLQQITFRSNIIPWYSPDEKHTARLLKALADEEQALTPNEPVERPAVPNARAPEDVLRAIPGVGAVAARKMIDRFGTVAAVMSASKDELRATVGSKTGDGAYEILNRRS